MPFVPHMSVEEAAALQIGDEVDYRMNDEITGLWYPALVTKKNDTILIVRDVLDRFMTCDYTKDIHLLAKPYSISRRPSSRLQDLKEGDKVDVKPTLFSSEWTWGAVSSKLHASLSTDQIQVKCSIENASGISHKNYVVHLDNEFEISPFGSKREVQNTGPFISHMSFEDADKLRANDRIDYRTNNGIVLAATILEKNGTILTICFGSEKNTKNDQCDYSKSLNKIAKLGSISSRRPHRLEKLKIGDYVDIKLAMTNYKWRSAIITHAPELSAQVKVSCKDYVFWVHVDNISEIAPFGTQTGPFIAHMTFDEADKLLPNDKVDYRKKNGFVETATVHEKNGTILTLHIPGTGIFSVAVEILTCDYRQDLNKIANAGSINGRLAHRLSTVQEDDYVDINIPLTNNQWTYAKLISHDSQKMWSN
eukprot:30586_1